MEYLSNRRPTFRRTALIVDHDPGNLALAAAALSAFTPGFRVATAPDGETGHAWLEALFPDLLLLDMHTPGAAALAARLAADPRADRCRVILTTAAVDLPTTTPPLAAVSLPAPLRLSVLLRAVRELFNEAPVSEVPVSEVA